MSWYTDAETGEAMTGFEYGAPRPPRLPRCQVWGATNPCQALTAFIEAVADGRKFSPINRRPS